MEFHEKLQQLRKQKNLTQEELAELLFVSRTAISKWESGRGLPNIDSLKAISKVFSISIDELLSGEEIIQAAENEKRENTVHLRNILYGLMDIMCAVFFFVPIFGERDGNYIRSVSVLNLQFIQKYMVVSYIVILGLIVLYGLLEIILQNFQNIFWKKNSAYISMALTVIATFIFIMSQQPYLAFFELWLLIIKAVLYIKQR